MSSRSSPCRRVDARQLFRFAEIQLPQGAGDGLAGGLLAVEGGAVLHVHADAIHAKGDGLVDLVPVVAGHVEQSAS
jgi:hypothetical protein